MRSTDDQLREILRRSEIIKEKKTLRRSILTEAVVSAVCLVLILLFTLYVPNTHTAPAQNTATQYGSLLLGAPYAAYVIVAILAFTLGICVSLLCYHWRKLKEQEKK